MPTKRKAAKPVRKSRMTKSGAGAGMGKNPSTPAQTVRAQKKPTLKKPPPGKTKVKGHDPRLYLAGAAPGVWASNHQEEANQVKGWQFVAIRTLARMCCKAELTCHAIEQNPREALRIVEKKLRRLERNVFDPLRKAVLLDRLEAKRDTLIQKLASTSESVKPARKPLPESHPLVRLLNRPNPEMGRMLFMFALVQQIGATAVGRIWTVRNEAGVPKEQYVLPTGLTIPEMPSPEYPNGSYWLLPLSAWRFQVDSTGFMSGALGQAFLTGARIDARDVKNIMLPHPIFPTDGLSPLAAGSLWVDSASEMDRATFYKFQNSERPGLVFKRQEMVDPSKEDMAQFRQDLKAEAAGTPNTGKHLIVPKGFEVDKFGETVVEMDYADTRPQIRDMNLALHGVNSKSCGITEAGGYSDFWAAIKQTTELAVQPMLDLIASEQTHLLGRAWPNEDCEISLNAAAIDDPQLLENRLATDISAKNVMLVKEYRALRGLRPFGDERDDAFVGQEAQSNATTVANPGLASGDSLDPHKSSGDGSELDTVHDRARVQDMRRSDGGVDGPDIRTPGRDAAPGRRDLNGKAMVLKATDASGHEHDAEGKFTGSGGGSGHKKEPHKMTVSEYIENQHEIAEPGGKAKAEKRLKEAVDKFKAIANTRIRHASRSKLLDITFDERYSKEVRDTVKEYLAATSEFRRYEITTHSGHEKAVRDALAIGIHVPPEVMTDYPELQSEYGVSPADTSLHKSQDFVLKTKDAHGQEHDNLGRFGSGGSGKKKTKEKKSKTDQSVPHLSKEEHENQYQQLASAKRHGEDIGGFDPRGDLKHLPENSNSIREKILDAAAKHVRDTSVGITLDKLYEQVGIPEGISPQQFRAVMLDAYQKNREGTENNGLQLGGWARGLDEVPRPDLVPIVSSKPMWYAHMDNEKAHSRKSMLMLKTKDAHGQDHDNLGRFGSGGGSSNGDADKPQSARERYQHHREHMHAAREEIRQEYKTAKEAAEKQMSEADSYQPIALHGIDHIGWPGGTHTEVESLIHDYDEDWTASEKFSFFKELADKASDFLTEISAVKAGEVIEGGEGETWEQQDIDDNKKSCKQIIGASRAAQDHLRDYAKHRKTMREIKDEISKSVDFADLAGELDGVCLERFRNATNSDLLPA